jgi:hypothetical protein
MSFAACVQWFDGGHPASVPLALVENVFGATISHREDARWHLRHGVQDCCELHLKTRPRDEVIALTVSRPCDAPNLWEGIHTLLRAGNGVCYWPGGAPLIASPGVAAHLPEDILSSLGEPVVVVNGAAIAQAVATT